MCSEQSAVLFFAAGIIAQPVYGQPQAASSDDRKFTLEDRLKWTAMTSASPKRFAGFAITSAIPTAANEPPEYGPHWDGYAKRFGLRTSTSLTGLWMESGLGSVWGEDPRYFRSSGESVKRRLWHATKMAFLARNPEDRIVPAYARYIAITGNSYLSTRWRPDTDSRLGDATRRVPVTFLNRILANSLSEFWPDVKSKLKRRPK